MKSLNAARALFFLGLSVASPVIAADDQDLKKAGALNAAAAEKTKQGDLDGAELNLLAALEYSDHNPKVQKNLGVVHYEKGMRAIGLMNYYEAERYLKSALAIEPGNERYASALSNAFFAEANLKVKSGQNDAGLLLYEQAVQTDKTNIRALTQASYCAWTIQKFDLARKYLSQAKAINPKDKNVELLEKKIAESTPEAVMGNENSEHFILSAEHEFIAKLGGHNILTDLEEAYNEVSYQLNFFPKNRISVVFYRAGEFHEQLQLPHRVNGYFDGKVRISYTADIASVELMKPMIRHELTHAFVNAMERKPIPHWINEGLAQWIEGKKMDTKTRGVLVMNQVLRRVPDIERLDQAFLGQRNPFNNSEMTLVYIKSLSLVEYLIKEKGMASITQFIQDGGSGVSTNDLFKKYFNATAEEIQQGWLRWLGSQKTIFGNNQK